MNKKERKKAIEREKTVVLGIATVLKKAFGSTWNFEINLESGDVTRNFTLSVKVYKR